MAFDAIAEVVVLAIAQFVVGVLFVDVFYWPGAVFFAYLRWDAIHRLRHTDTTASLSP